MKKSIIISILLIIGTIGLIATDSLLDYIRAESDGNAIAVKWKSNDESTISSFNVERAGADMIYEEINREQAKGYPSTYKYVDESAFKLGEGSDKTLAKTTYYYRVVINKKDGSKTYSNYATVAHNPSSFRRTWGMLKEMFR